MIQFVTVWLPLVGGHLTFEGVTFSPSQKGSPAELPGQYPFIRPSLGGSIYTSINIGSWPAGDNTTSTPRKITWGTWKTKPLWLISIPLHTPNVPCMEYLPTLTMKLGPKPNVGNYSIHGAFGYRVETMSQLTSCRSFLPTSTRGTLLTFFPAST